MTGKIKEKATIYQIEINDLELYYIQEALAHASNRFSDKEFPELWKEIVKIRKRGTTL